MWTAHVCTYMLYDTHAKRIFLVDGSIRILPMTYLRVVNKKDCRERGREREIEREEEKDEERREKELNNQERIRSSILLRLILL